MNFRFVLLLAALMATSTAICQSLVLDSSLISSGSANTALSSCYRVDSSIGEPVVGVSSSSTYALIAGFVATLPKSDIVFANHFEECAP
jgi:hypothetical protein